MWENSLDSTIHLMCFSILPSLGAKISVPFTVHFETFEIVFHELPEKW